ncbi:MAG: cysteine desulfurase family protein [Syntrophaceticus sp.]|nr:cysteine desulfurase family protein [Syntrophaceticus sp.]
MTTRRQVYLDHAATTPVHSSVLQEMHKVLDTHFGNPSSLHFYGRAAQQHLEVARQRVARLMGAGQKNVIFTSGGTEADNLAIVGTALSYRERGRHIITSTIEHHAVLDTCHMLSHNGFDVTFLPVDEDGVVDPDDVRKAIRPETILITIMHANNEIGTIEPIPEIGEIAREHDIIFHTDAVQTAGYLPLNVDDLFADLLSVSAHKIYGPKGAGALYVREGIKLKPLFHGGGQERTCRPGTENLPGIVGLGKAAEIAIREQSAESKRYRKLSDLLIRGIKERIPGARLNGHPQHRLPHNVNISFRGVKGECLLVALDKHGIAVSTGSACSSDSTQLSHVLEAIGLSEKNGAGTIRMTVGRSTTEDDIEYVLHVLVDVVEQLRREK